MQEDKPRGFYPITDADLRAAGYTPAAREYPLSERAIRRLCAHNNISIELIPNSWKYAPNLYCWEACEGWRNW